MNQELLIKTCQRLGELEGMENCPLRYAKFDDMSDRLKGIKDTYTWWPMRHGGVQSGMQISDYPYLPTNDLSEWSSAKILARAGYGVERGNTGWWLSGNMGMFDERLAFYNDPFCDIPPLPREYQELANMLGIIKLYEIDRLAYDKGMKLLLEKK